MSNKNRDLVSSYYEMWNSQEFDRAEQFLSSELRFHGSLDVDTVGIDEFKEYAKNILSAFPNLYHAPEIIVSSDPQVAVYVTYSGTHKGKLFEYEATNNRISYSGASFFTIRDGKISDIKVLGDRYSLYKQISSK